jgi:hypothetical protein
VRRSLRLDGILQWLPRMALLHDSAVRYTTGNKVVGLTGFSPATFRLRSALLVKSSCRPF